MPQKSCAKCGKPVNAGDKFCPSCGAPIGSPKGGAGRRLNDHVIVIGVFAAVILVYAGYHLLKDKPQTHTRRDTSAATTGGMNDMAAFVASLPEAYESLVSMGNALMDEGRYDMAVECYKKAVQENDQDPDVLIDLGACQHSLGMNEEAMVNIEKGLAINPDHLVGQFNLGVVHLTLGDSAAAVQTWERLLEQDIPQDFRTRTEALISRIGGG